MRGTGQRGQTETGVGLGETTQAAHTEEGGQGNHTIKSHSALTSHFQRSKFQSLSTPLGGGGVQPASVVSSGDPSQAVDRHAYACAQVFPNDGGEGSFNRSQMDKSNGGQKKTVKKSVKIKLW